MAAGASKMRRVLDGESDADRAPTLGARHGQTGRLILSAERTWPTAEAYVREFHEHKEGRTLHAHHGRLMGWIGNRYVELEDAAVKHRLHPWLHNALRIRIRGQQALVVDFEANPTTVNQALESIKNLVHLPDATELPSWLDGRTDPPAPEILSCRSLNLHMPTGRILPATPALFAVNALDFDYNPAAPRPRRFEQLLEELFGDDTEAIDTLGEFFGYGLSGDTSLQKMLLIVGPRRSGKGTLGRVFARLAGVGNVANPTTGSLAGPFGLQPLIGKSLAIVSDARFTGESAKIVVERLLNISGEDSITIDQKFLPSVTMKLPTRFVFLTNELPRLSDASTALAGRFIVLRLTRSFYGSEDATLTDQLLGELPGILLWALDGWKRLHARGRFQQPTSAAEAIRDLEDLSSPVGAFVRADCVIGAGKRVDVDNLFRAWRQWSEAEGRSSAGTKQSFGKGLTAAFPGVKRKRGTNDVAFYEGIGLRGAA